MDETFFSSLNSYWSWIDATVSHPGWKWITKINVLGINFCDSEKHLGENAQMVDGEGCTNCLLRTSSDWLPRIGFLSPARLCTMVPSRLCTQSLQWILTGRLETRVNFGDRENPKPALRNHNHKKFSLFVCVFVKTPPIYVMAKTICPRFFFRLLRQT